MASNKEKQNAYKRAMGAAFENQAREYEAQKKANDAKIKRLKSAKKRLEATLKEYETFKKNVRKIESEISSSNFKGDIRNKFKKKIESAVKQVNSDINKHQSNSARISSKISELEAENGNLVGWAKSCWDSAASFFQSLV